MVNVEGQDILVFYRYLSRLRDTELETRTSPDKPGRLLNVYFQLFYLGDRQDGAVGHSSGSSVGLVCQTLTVRMDSVTHGFLKSSKSVVLVAAMLAILPLPPPG